MQRFFGQASNTPKPTLGDAITKQDERANQIQERINKIDQQLAQLKPKLHIPSQKQRAMQLLQQKKQYEAQQSQMMNISYNMTNTQLHVDQIENTKVIVDTMKQSTKQMKSQMKKMDVGKIEDLQYELEELMENSTEIQDVLGRSYNVDVNEADLELELQQLEDMDLSELMSNIPTTEPTASVPATTTDQITTSPTKGTPIPGSLAQ
jgi:charged multivesicular body protein 5